MIDRNQTIAAEVATGLYTLAEVGAKWGLTKERVRQIAKRSGVTVRAGMRSERRRWRTALIVAYAQAHSDEAAAAEFGLSAYRVADLRLAAGIRRKRQPGDYHGTANGYSRYGCRCGSCRGANRAVREQMKRRGPSSHGYSGYTNYGCRCDTCKAANSEWNRRHGAGGGS